jgi:hypothetical protein
MKGKISSTIYQIMMVNDKFIHGEQSNPNPASKKEKEGKRKELTCGGPDYAAVDGRQGRLQQRRCRPASKRCQGRLVVLAVPSRPHKRW